MIGEVMNKKLSALLGCFGIFLVVGNGHARMLGFEDYVNTSPHSHGARCVASVFRGNLGPGIPSFRITAYSGDYSETLFYRQGHEARVYIDFKNSQERFLKQGVCKTLESRQARQSPINK